jgi:hypothetical protein
VETLTQGVFLREVQEMEKRKVDKEMTWEMRLDWVKNPGEGEGKDEKDSKV